MSKAETIIIQSRRAMLVPQHQCVGANLNGHRYKMVHYNHRDYILLDWSVETVRIFAALGLQLETPMRSDYNWPGKYTPYNHQLLTSEFFACNHRAFCFNDIGTGKTLSALWAADFLMQRGEVNKVLICSTLSTLNRVWEDEIFTHFMHRKAVVLHGSKARRKRELSIDADFYIINHAGIKVLQNELLARPDIDLVIADEGAVFRNKRTGLWTSMYTLAGEHTKKRLWWMTGSPMPKAPTDAWGQAMIVNPKAVPQYFSRFREQCMYKVTQFKWVPRRGWEDICYSALKPSIRFQRDDCIDLPECTYVDHPVTMTPQQTLVYQALVDQFLAELDDDLITASNEGAKLVKLLQVACGAVYNDQGEVSTVNCDHKIDELNQIMKEVGTKLIVFVPFKHSIQVLVEWLTNHDIDYSYGVVNGDVPMKKRDVIFRDFQEGDLDLLIAHPAAMAHGLTLTAANTIAWFGPVDNFEIYEQANGRITRPGQTRKQYIKHLICSPVEQVVYKRLKSKEGMQGLLLDMIKN